MFYTSEATLNDIVDRVSDYTNIDLRADYSGRGMYGRNCIGFTTDDSTMLLMALTAILIEIANEQIHDDAPEWENLSPRQDSMGLSTIVYFPNWQLDTE